MTTLLGIKTNHGIDGIVLAADCQESHWKDNIFYKKDLRDKIYYGKHCIMANVGAIGDNPFAVFLETPKKEIDRIVREAVQKYDGDPFSKHPHFEKINQVNTQLYREHKDHDYLHSLVLATETYGKLELWEVDEFGNLKQPKKKKKLQYITLGSGKKYVKRYINCLLEEGRIDETEINISKAIDVAVAAITEAQKDPHTSGLNLAVLTAKGVGYFGDFIQETIERKKKSMIDLIKREYR